MTLHRINFILPTYSIFNLRSLRWISNQFVSSTINVVLWFFPIREKPATLGTPLSRPTEKNNNIPSMGGHGLFFFYGAQD